MAAQIIDGKRIAGEIKEKLRKEILIGDNLLVTSNTYLPRLKNIWGLKKLEEGDSITAKRTSLIVGVIGGVIGLAPLIAGQFTGAHVGSI